MSRNNSQISLEMGGRPVTLLDGDILNVQDSQFETTGFEYELGIRLDVPPGTFQAGNAERTFDLLRDHGYRPELGLRVFTPAALGVAAPKKSKKSAAS